MGAPHYRSLLTPQNSGVVFIDPQPGLIACGAPMEANHSANGVVALAKAAQIFAIPTILTTLQSEALHGEIGPDLLDLISGIQPIKRTCLSAWESQGFVEALKGIDRRRLILVGFWPEASLAFSALCALEEGFDIYVVANALGDTPNHTTQIALHRLTHAGAILVTWRQVLWEWQRDFARTDTCDAVFRLGENCRSRS